MPNIQDLSDAELAAMAGGGGAPDITKLSDAELQSLAGPAQQGGVGFTGPAASGIGSQRTSGLLGMFSIPNMVEGLYNTIKSAPEVTKQVMTGQLDPASEEGIKQVAPLAALAALPSPGRSMARAVAPAETAAVADLKAAATPTYERLTELGNTVPLTPQVKTALTQDVVSELGPKGLRSANAPRTYREITRMSGANDLNDIAIARDKMRDIANGISENRLIKVAGQDSTAARQAMNMLDSKIEELSPGWVDAMKTADANWAAARRAETVLKEADKGQKGRLGSFDTNETRAKGFTKEELAAVKRAHQGGIIGAGLNAIGSGLNPFHGSIPSAVTVGAHAIASPMTFAAGVPAGILADVLAKSLRKRSLNQAIQKIISRSPVARSLVPSPTLPLALPPLRLPQATLGLPAAMGLQDTR